MMSGSEHGPPEVTVRIERDPRGGWRVAMPGGNGLPPCETLEEAQRVAYLSAPRGRVCELIVHDAYHRVLDRVVIEGAAKTRGRRPS